MGKSNSRKDPGKKSPGALARPSVTLIVLIFTLAPVPALTMLQSDSISLMSSAVLAEQPVQITPNTPDKELKALWLAERYHKIALHHSDGPFQRPLAEQYMVATALCRINQRKGILHGHTILEKINRELQRSEVCMECTAPLYRILQRESSYCVLANLNRRKHRPPARSLPDLLTCICPPRDAE